MPIPSVFNIVAGNTQRQARITPTGAVWVYVNGWRACGQLYRDDPDPLATARRMAEDMINWVVSGKVGHPDRP